jgi:hypothetical protein
MRRITLLTVLVSLSLAGCGGEQKKDTAAPAADIFDKSKEQQKGKEYKPG